MSVYLSTNLDVTIPTLQMKLPTTFASNLLMGTHKLADGQIQFLFIWVKQAFTSHEAEMELLLTSMTSIYYCLRVFCETCLGMYHTAQPLLPG